MKKLFLSLALALGAGAAAQAQVAYQGFDNFATNSWTFTASPAAYNFAAPLSDVWDDTSSLGTATGTNVAISAPAQGTGFWGAWDLENPHTTGTLGLAFPYSHTLDFSPVALNPLTAYTFQFKYFNHLVGGTGDSIGYYVEYNNGTTWSTANYVGMPAANAAWDSTSVSVPAGSTFIRVRFRYIINGNNDWAGLDAVKVVAGAVTAPAVIAFRGAYKMVDEASDTLRIPVGISNRNSQPSIIRVRRVTGFGTASASDITPLDTALTWTATSPDTLYARYLIANDALPEAAEYFAVELTGTTNAGVGSASNYTAYILDNDYVAPQPKNNLQITHRGSFAIAGTGSSAEISAWDSGSNRLFVVNSLKTRLHILSFANPGALVQIDSIDMTQYGGGINSVAVHKGLVAVAVEAAAVSDKGKIVFLDTAGHFIKEVPAGYLPDMVCFSPDGRWVLAANEAQPASDYTFDPEGSVTMIDLQNGVLNATAFDAGFAAYNGQEATLRTQGIRIFGPGANASKDMEPEYITINKTSDTAWVTLQENNAVATIHIPSKTVTSLRALGTVDNAAFGNGMDVSDQTNAIAIANWPVKSLYMPDAIASYQVAGQTYLITANEGDARDYNALAEEVRVSSSAYKLDTTVFKNSTLLKAPHNLGRLNATNTLGDTDGDGDFDEIYAFGGRSFSIWNGATGALVYNSGDKLEHILSQDPKWKRIFNASNNNVVFKDRSDAKGPEPEGVCVGYINDTPYAFVALERVGGFMTFNVAQPATPVFNSYNSYRDTVTATGDLGAEGILFISHKQSRDRKSYVVTSNEISGSVGVFEVTPAGGYTDVGVGRTPQLAAWHVYPNPTVQGVVYFSQPATGTVMNAAGSVVGTFSKANHFATANLAAGVYFIYADGLQTQKLVVE